MVEFELDPSGKFDKSVKKALKDIDDLSLPFKLMTESWYKSNKAIWSLKSKGKYKDLSTKPFRAFWENKRGFAALYAGGYKEYKQVNFGFVYPILKVSGKLENSMTNPGGSGAIAKIIGKKALILGTKVTSKDGAPYGKFLQLGTSKMPARPFVLLGAEQTAPSPINKRTENWVKLLEDYVIQSSKGFAT